MELEQGKSLGGSTLINYCVWARGQPGDFDCWDSIHGCSGWGSNDVEPYFEDIEKELTAATRSLNMNEHAFPFFSETQAFIKSAQMCGVGNLEMGLDYNNWPTPPTNVGVCGPTQFSADCRKARRLNAFNSLIEPILSKQLNEKCNFKVTRQEI